MTVATVTAVLIKAPKDGGDISVVVVLLCFGDNWVKLLDDFVDHCLPKGYVKIHSPGVLGKPSG